MNTEINTNVRMFDLVRYMRAELHDADLITDQEYAWLGSPMATSHEGGSPSPRRLEDYSGLIAERNNLREALITIMPLARAWADAASPAGVHKAKIEAAYNLIRTTTNL